jgi:hypothetical protein
MDRAAASPLHKHYRKFNSTFTPAGSVRKICRWSVSGTSSSSKATP